MKNLRLNISKGFTMVELLIYMGILSIFMGVLTNMFLSVLDVQLESQATSSVEQDGRFILARLSYDIHRAQSIIAPSLGGQAGTLSLNIGGVVTNYAVNSNNLELSNDTGTNNLNSFDTEISNFSVTRLGNSGGKNTLSLSFTINGKTVRQGNITETRMFQTTVGIR